jgi:hypothetical protein
MADGYEATHAVPATGLPAWPVPDGSGPPAATLDPGLDIQVFERRADWAHVRCSNGWEAWIDGRDLVALGVSPVAPPPVPDAPTPTPPAEMPVPMPIAPAPTAHADAPAPMPIAPGVPAVAAATAPAPGGARDAWAAGAAPPSRRVEIGAPQLLVLAGSVLVIVATFLPWLELGRSDFNAFKVPVNFLGDGTTEEGAVKIGVVLAVLAGLGIVSVFLRPVRWFGIVTGVLVLAVGARFIMEVGPLLDELEGSEFSADRFDVVKFGVYVVLVGGLLTLVGGALSLRKSR